MNTHFQLNTALCQCNTLTKIVTLLPLASCTLSHHLHNLVPFFNEDVRGTTNEVHFIFLLLTNVTEYIYLLVDVIFWKLKKLDQV